MEHTFVLIWKSFVHVLIHQWCLANTTFTKDDDLKKDFLSACHFILMFFRLFLIEYSMKFCKYKIENKMILSSSQIKVSEGRGIFSNSGEEVVLKVKSGIKSRERFLVHKKAQINSNICQNFMRFYVRFLQNPRLFMLCWWIKLFICLISN